MRITVTVEVDVDLDAWQLEYKSDSAAHALREALVSLRDRDEYLHGRQWDGLAKVHSVEAIVELNKQPIRAARGER